MKRCLFSVIKILPWVLCIFSTLLDAQQRGNFPFTGIIRNAETHEFLSNVNLRVFGTSMGTTTNTEGTYQILFPPGRHQIIISCIGYRSDTIEIEMQSTPMKKNIELTPAAVILPSFDIFADAPNPAEEIIRRAIETKRSFLSKLHSYQFGAYTKTTMRVVSQKDSTADTTIFGLLETQTDGYWKAPDHYKEIITARRQSANFTPSQNIFTVGQILNFNDDVIIIEPYSVIGPTAPNALSYYSFEMIDTLAIDNIMIYRIRMKPKSSSRPLFNGTIAIAHKTYQVVEVDVHGNEALNIPLIDDVHFHQQFALYDNIFWLPIQLSMRCSVTFPLIPFPPMFIEQISLIHNYLINNDIPDSLFDQYLLTTEPSADHVDSVSWTQQNVLLLTTQEVSAYHTLDSIMTNMNFHQSAIYSLIRLPLLWEDLPLTQFSDFFRFNRVEGVYLGGGLSLTHLTPTTALTLRGGYGCADARWKYQIDAEQYFSASHSASLGIEYHHEYQFRERSKMCNSDYITWLALLDHNDPVDYFSSSGWSIYDHFRFLPGLSLEIRYRDEIQSSLSKKTDFSIFSPSRSYRTNTSILDGHLRSSCVSILYDTRKFLNNGASELIDQSENTWQTIFNVEYSGKSLLKSDFDFTRVEATLHRHQLTFGSGTLDIYFKLGYSSGALPPQRLFDLDAQISGISTLGALKTIANKEFSGDRFALFQVKHNFGSMVFRALGVSFIKNIDLILYAGAGWTDISAPSAVLQTSGVGTTQSILYEVGFGLDRILPFLVIDFSWRLTHHTGNNFQITIGSSLL